MREQTRRTIQRQRLSPAHRWTIGETLCLLTTILDELKTKPGSFEQPSAFRFYKKIWAKTPSLQHIDVFVYRNKMRNMKTNYIKALWLLRRKQQHDPKVKETIKNICPYFHLLSKIYTAPVNSENPSQTEIISSAAEDSVASTLDTSHTTKNLSSTSKDISLAEIPRDLKWPIKIQGRPRNSSKNIKALSNLIGMHEQKLQFEAIKWHKQIKYEQQKLELERAAFEMRLMDVEEDFAKQKEDLLMQEKLAKEQLQSRVKLLERLSMKELATKLGKQREIKRK